MPSLGDTLVGLMRQKRLRDTVLADLPEPLRLTETTVRASNPGDLRMMTFVPPGLPSGAPLVVVLHGCTQNAASYDHGAGWSLLARRHGFALLFPEQTRANNANLCFNWFQDADTTRGHGEVESIRQMAGQMVGDQHLDPRRVFITGLSAGGAMTAAMLATAPDLFAAGAIIAGLPYGSANSMSKAFQAMGQGVHHSPREWGDLVRAAAPHRGPRPAVQVWQGTADTTVNPANAQELVKQWTDVLDLPAEPSRTDTVDGAAHSTWRGTDGTARLELFLVPGLAHGTPVATVGSDADQLTGVPGPHMLAAPIGATWHLARSWGLLTQAPRPVTAQAQAQPHPKANPAAVPLPGGVTLPLPGGADGVIARALQKAGLLR